MLFHTKKWGWTRLAAGMLLAPLALSGGPSGLAAAPPTPASIRTTSSAGDPKLLLRDAKAALEAGDFNKAQDLTQQAEASNSTGKWGLFDDTPASLRKKIASARQAAGKHEVARLLKDARDLFARPANSDAERASNVNQALKLARKADYLHGPDYSVWETGERPDRLIREIEATAMKTKGSRIPTPPVQASTLAAQEAGKPKPTVALPPPPLGSGNATVAPLAISTVASLNVTTTGIAKFGGADMVEVANTKGRPTAPMAPLVAANASVAPSATGIIPPMPPMNSPTTPQMPAMPVASVAMNENRALAMRLVIESKALSVKGEFVAARSKLMEADALKVEFAANEGPGFAMQELNALAAEVKDKLVREAQDCIGKRDLARAEAAIAGAEQIATGLKLAAQDVEKVRADLKSALTPAVPPSPVASTPPVSGPAPLPAMVLAPPATPALTNPLPATRPLTMAPPAMPGGTGQLTGQQLLEQATLELQKGDLAMATVIARQAYNRDSKMQASAQALLNQIDAESFRRKKDDAEKSFDNAVRGYATRDYSMTLGVLALIDPRLLPAEKQTRREELMKECHTSLDGSRGMVQTASAQEPAAPGASAATAQIASKDPPLMKVDTQPMELSPRTEAGLTKDANTGFDSAKQAQAMRDVLMQKLRQEGLRAMEDSHAAFGRGETDLAINTLNEYTNRVRGSTLDASRTALLLKPIDTRLTSYRTLRGHVDSLSREKKEKQDSKDILAARNAAEEQRNAEVTRLFRECTVLIKEKKDYEGAERLALQMKQLDPDSPAVELISHQAKMLRRTKEWEQIKNGKESFVLAGLNQAEKVGPVVSMENPLTFQLERFTKLGRRGADDPYQKSRSQAEFEIEMKLERPVILSFQQTPLKIALQNIAEKSQIPVWFDNTAINSEGSASLEAPVDADFNVSAKNALAVLLEGASLSYVIENDMVKITTMKKSKGRLFTKVFSVADLVTPVPNFALPDYANLSKILGKSAIDSPQALINGNTVRNAMGQGQMASTPSSNGVGWDPVKGTGGNGGKLENFSQSGNPATQSTTNNGFGTQFTQSMTKHEQLIKLVTGMVRPLTWDASGGNGRIEFYDIGAALVVNQTGDVIREVADLLEALRRLQDLAVAIEMRIVSLSETFFERMGVDFSVNVQTSNTRLEPNFTGGGSGTSIFRPDPFINSLNGVNGTVGLTPAGTFTPDLNVPVRSTSFNYAIPGFGNYPNNPGANGGLSLGLAFLNDIQVYMFMEAAQGDRRQNIMQAPKITLFNGQTATISITDFAYFVTNVQVFSVNGQVVFVPQNTPLPIGTQGSLGGQIGVQAVVSADRRFVRITPTVDLQTISGALTPLFPVTTFITPVFEGGSQGQPIPFTQFLQQPSLATINVQTTVVCPDGGTVLMGGFKYLAESRNEFGPPFLSKIPYLNRLFKNVGIGRETRHLMLMITPRIIITAEEELIQTEGVRFPGQ